MPNRVIVKGNVGNALHSVAPDHILGTAEEIFDESSQEYQSEINAGAVRADKDQSLTEEQKAKALENQGVVIAQGTDFTNPDATKRAKVPTVGAVLDGLNDGVYDVSKRNPTGGPNSDGKFTLEYILNNADTLIPTSRRHGGMLISFVDSSDNKYVQYRLMATAWSTSEVDWQGVDDEPTAESENLINSGSVKEVLNSVSGTIDSGTVYDSSNYGYGSRVSVFYPLDGSTKNFKLALSNIVYASDVTFIVSLRNSKSIYSSALVRQIANYSSVTSGSNDITLSEEELASAKYIAVIASADNSSVSFKSTLTMEEGENVHTNAEDIEDLQSDVVDIQGDITSINAQISALDSKVITYYRACDTARDEPEKTLLVPNFTPSQKARLLVKFDYPNIADNVTLNVNGTGAYPLYLNGKRCSSVNTWVSKNYVDIFFRNDAYYGIETPGVHNILWELDGYVAASGVFVSDDNYKTSGKIFVRPRLYSCSATFISKYDVYGNFIERVSAASTGYIEFDSSVSFIRISNTVSALSSAFFSLFFRDSFEHTHGYLDYVLNGAELPTFVDGLPQIKELYFNTGSDYGIVWIRKGFVSGTNNPYWGIAFEGGAETLRYSSAPTGVMPIYSDTNHTTIIGYVIVDWSKQTATSVSGSSATIQSICYDVSSCRYIAVYLGTFNENQGLLPFAQEAAGLIYDLREESRGSVNLVSKFNVAAISWVDDDFMINSSSNTEKYAVLKSFCESNGFFADMALIPSDATDVDTEDGSLATKIEAVREWENVGFRFLYHPVHYGWYTNSWNTQNISEVKRRLVEEIRLFLQNSIILRSRILVWPGSSNTFSDNSALVKKYCDCAISTNEGYNVGVETSQYQLKRLFPETLMANGTTKTEVKAQIAAAVEAGAWLILGSHIWNWTVSDTLDETSLTTANLFDIMSYANSLTPILPVEKCWENRKLMFDWYKV